MMDNGKYIVLNSSNIIIFSAILSHNEVAAGFTNNKVTSAGFIVTDVDDSNEVRVQCFGKSMTLNIESDPDNDARLARYAIGDY